MGSKHANDRDVKIGDVVDINRIIVEKVDKCKFVKYGSEPNGHDCWGNYESTSYEYVMIGDEREKILGRHYVLHDDCRVLSLSYDWNLQDKILGLIDEKHNAKKEAAERKEYEKLKAKYE